MDRKAIWTVGCNMAIYLTADDLHCINQALSKGDDVEIRKTPDGVKITAKSVRTIKKKQERKLPNKN